MALPLGTLVLDKSFTFQGPDAKNPNLMQITMEGRVSIEPAPNVMVKIRAQEGKGTLTFDKQNGRLVSSRGTQKTDMLIVQGGQEADQIDRDELGHDARAVMSACQSAIRGSNMTRPTRGGLRTVIPPAFKPRRASSSC